jgi:DNA-directed RNA polymerase subunit RPC12/RpoP
MNNNQKKQAPKRKMLFCEPCGYKRILEPDGKAEGLTEIKTSPIQGALPTLDPVAQKTVTKPHQPQAPKYKCPCCGRGVKVKELLKPYADLFDKADEEKERLRLEEDKKKRILDGQPPEKKVDPDFLG